MSSTTAVQLQTHTQTKHTPNLNNSVTFSAMRATKVRETLLAFQTPSPHRSPLLARPYIYYQQETSFTAKEVLLSNWPDVIQWPGLSQPMGWPLF